VRSSAAETGHDWRAGSGVERLATEPERTVSRFGGQTGGLGSLPALAGLDSAEIRLAGTAGPSGHLGQLDEPAQGLGGLAESGSGGEAGGGGGLPGRGGDGGAVMPEGQELLQAGGGLQGGVQERVGAGARGPGSSAARPVTGLDTTERPVAIVSGLAIVGPLVFGCVL
jgi:hypothetical protein